MIGDDRFVIVVVTVPPGGTGDTIAEALVERRLAACVNRIPGVRSVYRWEGKVHRDEEEMLLLKTARTDLDEVEHVVEKLHPYDVPEMVVVPLEGGSASYFEWLAANTSRCGDV